MFIKNISIFKKLDLDENEVDQEILALLNSEEKDDAFGPSVNPAVALRMQKILEATINKEALEKIKQKLPTPDNCQFLSVPKVNPELWSQLPQKSKLFDARMQHTQQLSSKQLTVFSLIVNEITKSSKSIPNGVSESILKLCLDGATLATIQHKESIQRRMQAIKPLLSPNVSGICATANTTSRYLFGDNFTDALKSSRSVTNVLKRPAGNYRFNNPNFRPQQNNLNFRGQFRPQFRPQGGFRGRPQYNYRNRFNPPQNQNQRH